MSIFIFLCIIALGVTLVIYLVPNKETNEFAVRINDKLYHLDDSTNIKFPNHSEIHFNNISEDEKLRGLGLGKNKTRKRRRVLQTNNSKSSKRKQKSKTKSKTIRKV